MLVKQALLILLIAFGAAVMPVLAHESEVDGGMHVTLHTTPDDNPAAGQTTLVKVIYADETNNFKLADCDCRLVIKDSSGNTVSNQKLLRRADFSQANYEFPTGGDYQLTVSGTPAAAQEFTSFSVNFNVHVGKSESQLATENSAKQREVLILGALIALSSLGTVGLLARVNSRQS